MITQVLDPEEILETQYLWAIFSKKSLIGLSLQGPSNDDRWDHFEGDLNHITINVGEILTAPSQPFSNQTKLARETFLFLNTGTHRMPLNFCMFTPFQQKVFTEVQKVLPGTTTTYKQIAAQLGNPNAARAVGTAISLNPFAYFLPTHRVLPSTGKIGVCKGGAGHLRKKFLKREGHKFI